MTTKFLLILLFAIFYFCSGEGRQKRFSIRAPDTRPGSSRNHTTIQKVSNDTNTNHNRQTRQFRRPLPPLNGLPQQVLQNAGLPTTGGVNVANIRGQSGVDQQLTRLSPQVLQTVAQNVPNIGELSGVNNIGSFAATPVQATAEVVSLPVRPNNIGEAVLRRLKEPLRPVEISLTEEFNSFKNQFRKTYSSPQEELFRQSVFLENKRTTDSINEDFALGKLTFAAKVNEFQDLLTYEFNLLLNGFYAGNRTKRGSAFIVAANAKLPPSIDWRERGAVTSVKHQHYCAGCYAFSATGSLEGQIFRKTGQLRDLSNQNIIDCSRRQGNNGCGTGYVQGAFEYARDNPGIEAEATYPYEARDGSCRYKHERTAGYDRAYYDLEEANEKQLEEAVGTVGPISAAMDASLPSFKQYSRGVYFDPKCQNGPDKVNHAVLVVGYGTEPDGQQYWLIKNSHGTGWGIGGYMKLAKFRNNHCGIAAYATYPIL